MIDTAPQERKAWIPPQIIFLHGQQIKSGPLCLGAPEGSGGVYFQFSSSFLGKTIGGGQNCYMTAGGKVIISTPMVTSGCMQSLVFGVCS